MTAPLDITKRQVTAICEGAKAAGCAAVIQHGKLIIRLIPEEHAIDINNDKAPSKEKDFGL